MKKIEKVVIILLIMIISIQSVFPSVIYAYTQEEVLNKCKEEIDKRLQNKMEEIFGEYCPNGITDYYKVEELIKQRDEGALIEESEIERARQEREDMLKGMVKELRNFYLNELDDEWQDYFDEDIEADIEAGRINEDVLNNGISDYLNTYDEDIAKSSNYIETWLLNKYNDYNKNNTPEGEDVNIYISLSEAERLFNEKLAEIAAKQEAVVRQSETDYKAIRARMNEYFNDIVIKEYESKTGELYETALNLKEQILSDEEKQTFMDTRIYAIQTYFVNKYPEKIELTLSSQAEQELLVLLGEIYVRLDAQYYMLDDTEKMNAIIIYFNGLKEQYLQANVQDDNIYYNDIQAIKDIAEKIQDTNEREEFRSKVPEIIEMFMRQNFATAGDNVIGFFSVTMDVVAGLLLYIPKVVFIITPGTIIQGINTLLASIGTEGGVDKILTLDHILFNKVPMVDINIFDFETAGDSKLTGAEEGATTQNVLVKIRKNIARWYYAIRNLAIVFGLLVLIYIGIRMAMSSIAEDKAKYKKMFADWLVSFALIFVLHYLMIFIIQLNDGLVEILANAHEKQGQELASSIPVIFGLNIETQTLQGRLLAESFSPLLTRSLASSFIYLILSAMTFFFLIVYTKRFITIGFLVTICPLITITYAIDKAGDGKAQALNKWIKEFVFNIIIQPFHCIIYMVFLQNIFYVINNTAGVLQFGKIFVAIIMMGFIYKAEDIVKGIFGIQAHNLTSAAILGGMAISKVSQASGMVKTGISGGKNAGDMANKMKGIKTPNSLPSNPKPQTPPSPTKQRGKIATAVSKVAKPVIGATTTGLGKRTRDKVARNIAGKAVLGAIGYGLTGEYGGAVAATSAGSTVKKKYDDARLSSQVKKRKNDALDAYEDYKNSKGLSKEDMLEKSKELLDADIDTLTNDEDRNLAGWLQADKEAQKILGAKDPTKAVMEHLYEKEKM